MHFLKHFALVSGGASGALWLCVNQDTTTKTIANYSTRRSNHQPGAAADGTLSSTVISAAAGRRRVALMPSTDEQQQQQQQRPPSSQAESSESPRSSSANAAPAVRARGAAGPVASLADLIASGKGGPPVGADGLSPMMRAAGYVVVRPGVVRLPDGREMDEKVLSQVLEARARALGLKLTSRDGMGQSVEDTNTDEAEEIRSILRRSMFMGLNEQQTLDLVVSKFGPEVLIESNFDLGKAALYAIPGIIAASLVLAAVTSRRAKAPPKLVEYAEHLIPPAMPVSGQMHQYLTNLVTIPPRPSSRSDVDNDSRS
ncbi:hypothetical protein CAOG_05322 [Capsaspora owczarzaki ATCC 30864]|uniref:CcmH/CycL/Ccl2/NrfF N-terminal domain-containing protein n=1 Tax=Capsaspora owczarzaki (strain ATCC 30864) TaxID=595528 RepID=A0A0D2X3Q6_CAPO3|nr:hypothetical protein CAOG_05322 [Capsaspora owczarzaki ATCC 30864]KJE94724.1 hypothetical protein CAOG_005322 [Capsaspora owczarzaki ATCC 30864]|eukprot:XP_004347007.1 hypothetical protein CAOG_05322 [Capsaspora owczarzaki ATCC 30864]